MRWLRDLWWSVKYRFRCPYPVNGYKSARACFAAGVCGCDNYHRLAYDPNDATKPHPAQSNVTER
jgi:hypothetical protein